MMLTDIEMDLTLLCMHLKLSKFYSFLVLKYLAGKEFGNWPWPFNVLEKKRLVFLSVYWETFDIGSEILQNEEKNKVLDVIKDKLVKYGVTKDQENERVSFFD